MNLRKNSKGSVNIAASKNKLLIRLPRQINNGKQQQIYTGLNDTPSNRKRVLLICLQIEADIQNLLLDSTFQKYREALRQLRTPHTIINESKPNLLELWVKYSNFKQSQIGEAYFEKFFLRHFKKSIESLPTREITPQAALIIRDYLLTTRSSDAAKRLLVQYNAACNWALKSKLIENNPFNGIHKDIKSKKLDWRSIDPFTHSEQLTIIQAFQNHPKYSGYKDFVKFLFLTGSRLNEAVALQWQHINFDCSQILICETFDDKFGRKHTTKTGLSRNFPCNHQLREFLINLRPVDFKSDDLLFQSPINGREIKLKTFHNVWHGYQPRKNYQVTGIIPELVKQGLVARYRKPYNIRHTFISNCLERGIPVTQIAQWVGNSPEIIYKHYAGIIQHCEVPEL